MTINRIIAGIGSRNTPKSILDEMIAIGQWCRQHQIWVRSGHAPGADQAFEQGAQEYCIAFLPWRGFEQEHFTSFPKYKVPTNWAMLEAHARQFHPVWMALTNTARKLIARNSAQVLGINLDIPVAAIVCWTKDGGPSGGTGQALRIAKANSIPVFNMHSPKYNTAALVTAELSKIFTIKG